MAKYLNPKADLTFKRVFGEHPELLISFLNAMLPLEQNRQIESIEYLTPEQPPDINEGKNSIVEVRCIDNSQRKFIVEMQVRWSTMFRNRTIFNSCKAYVRQLSKSEEYKLLHPVYTLVLLNSNSSFDDNKSEFYHHYKILNTKNPNKSLPGLEYVFVELKKFQFSSSEEEQTRLISNVALKKMTVLWLRFLTEVGEEMTQLPKELEENEDINLAADLCKEGAFTPEERAAYDAYWDAVRIQAGQIEESEAKGRAEGRVEGKAEGKAEGRAEEKIEIAKKALKKGMSIEDVIDMTGLTKDEIENIKNYEL